MKLQRIKIVLWIAALFFLGAVLMTFASFRIYHLALPTVTLCEQRSGTICREYSANATVGFHETTDYRFPISVTIQRVFVSPGDSITRGAPLFQVDINSLKGEELNLLLQMETLESSRDNESEDNISYQYYEYRINECKTSIDTIHALLESDGLVKSEETGIVTGLFVPQNAVISENTTILSTAQQSDGNMYLHWELSNDVALLFNKGNVVEAESFGTLTITNKSGRNYTCDVTTEVVGVFLPGETVKVRLTYRSVRYDHLIPVEAVSFIDDGAKGIVFYTQERKTLFGSELYVMSETFSVLDYDTLNVAADIAPGLDANNFVVIYASRSLSDGQAVRE